MGCQGVFHTASPEEILKPAIEGTLNVLRSCGKNQSLKRVVLTSSSSTVRIRDDFDPNIPLDDSVWYALSKTLAEQAAWKFCEENGIDLVTVLPSFLVGPSLPPDLCSTASDVLGLLKGETDKFQWHGQMGFEKLNRLHYDFDTSKIKSLGLKFRSLEEMFDDCIASFVEQGYLTSR
ncbi:unnamed protein product [Eruca vesicaria subsp. sativa]|uniref:NAD-dependent epimerase/dehydratase domain-containing protein n=1 Tax=Eruca vesicaria subsp. sativa TaxID=29727 RepID=A0ABC8JWL0_ERUVS|nr:unnamed protein product [Eruca vesicaria subsp. sativa]